MASTQPRSIRVGTQVEANIAFIRRSQSVQEPKRTEVLCTPLDVPGRAPSSEERPRPVGIWRGDGQTWRRGGGGKREGSVRRAQTPRLAQREPLAERRALITPLLLQRRLFPRHTCSMMRGVFSTRVRKTGYCVFTWIYNFRNKNMFPAGVHNLIPFSFSVGFDIKHHPCFWSRYPLMISKPL